MDLGSLCTTPQCGERAVLWGAGEFSQRGQQRWCETHRPPLCGHTAAPSDREAALLAENEMLREAAGAYFIRSLVGGRLPADVAAGRQARRALADILATPPGAAGQALLDALAASEAREARAVEALRDIWNGDEPDDWPGKDADPLGWPTYRAWLVLREHDAATAVGREEGTT